MTLLHLPSGTLEYELVDLTPPWRRQASTVVFMHGVGANLDIWSQWLPWLAGHHRLLRFSLRGFGGSQQGPVAPEPSLDLLARDLFSLADATGTEYFHLVAESFGGSIALHAALSRPERISSLCLMSTPCRGSDIQPLHAWPELATSEQGMARWNEEMMAGRFSEDALQPEARDWFRRIQANTDPTWLGKLARLILTTDLRDRLPQVQAPVLLMGGDASPYVGLTQIAALHALLPQSQVCVFPGARHGIAFSHARVCAEHFLAFAAGCRGSTPNEETK